LAFQVKVTDYAQSDLEKLPPKQRLQILKKANRLKDNPFPDSKVTKKLKTKTKAGETLYRLRAGGYRVVYLIQEKQVFILMVVHRKDFERALKDLSRGSRALTSAKSKKKLPDMSSWTDEQIAQFWETHSLADYWEELEEVEVTFEQPKTTVVGVRLEEGDVQQLKRLARRLGIGHSTLIRLWIKEKLREIVVSD
jgi:mRNA-degrading endonuclease RelE of RelBE toxin-antitoxin system